MHTLANLFVVSAPSGAGKSSLVRALRGADAGIGTPVSHTTRAPRGQEVHGREYYFVSDAAFDAMVAEGAFVEWATVHGRRYGTARQTLQACLDTGSDVLLEIDWQGALQVKRALAHAVLIFVLPPSLQELRARLEKRGEDADAVIALRLRNAAREVAQAAQFDFVIINDFFDSALLDLRAIIQAQRLRYACQRQRRSATFAALQISDGSP